MASMIQKETLRHAFGFDREMGTFDTFTHNGYGEPTENTLELERAGLISIREVGIHWRAKLTTLGEMEMKSSR